MCPTMFFATVILVTTLTRGADPAGIPLPAVTVCARETSLGIGWRKAGRKVGGKVALIQDDLVQRQCGGETQNVTDCVQKNTFNLTEVVGDMVMGFSGTRDLVEPRFWSEDFTWTVDGRCYTLNYPNLVKDEFYVDQLVIKSTVPSMFQIIFVHDPKLFVNNYNPKSMAMTRRKVTNNESYTMMITLVEHSLLNRASNPCVADPDYSFRRCVKDAFSSRFSPYNIHVLEFFLLILFEFLQYNFFTVFFLIFYYVNKSFSFTIHISCNILFLLMSYNF